MLCVEISCQHMKHSHDRSGVDKLVARLESTKGKSVHRDMEKVGVMHLTSVGGTGGSSLFSICTEIFMQGPKNWAAPIRSKPWLSS
jgi:hypothetical protein